MISPKTCRLFFLSTSTFLAAVNNEIYHKRREPKAFKISSNTAKAARMSNLILISLRTTCPPKPRTSKNVSPKGKPLWRRRNMWARKPKLTKNQCSKSPGNFNLEQHPSWEMTRICFIRKEEKSRLIPKKSNTFNTQISLRRIQADFLKTKRNPTRKRSTKNQKISVTETVTTSRK